MAEERDPSYGQLSTPSSAQAAIETPQQPVKQVNGKPRSVDTQRLAGNPITGPNNKAGMNNKQAMIAKLNSAASDLYTEDKHKYNKLTTFNSSHTGHNFDRYYAHPKFKQLGFSPFRDNESFYNQNSSLWDDAVRGGITASKLAWLGGSSTFKNWGSMFSSEGNTEDSDEMERLMSVGMSSRGGFGAKAVNFGVNMGYTYGVVSEILAEEAALWAAGTLGAIPSFGTTTALAVARTGMNLGRLTKAFEGFKAISSINKARELWNSSKVLGGVGKLANHLVPFEQSRALLTTGGKAAAKWGELDDMAKVSKTFGAFYRDLREINAVTSEARLEGGGIQSGVTNQLMAQFKKDNGRDPNDQEAEAIFRQAHQAGVTGTLMNVAGIYLSNKVVLNRALKGIPGMSSIGEGATRKIRGSFLLNKAWKAAGKDPYELVKGVKQLGKAAFYKQTFNPKNLVKGGLGYISANLMEGTQEVYQEAIANGLTDYFVSTYNDPSRAGSAEFRTKLLSGLKSQASEQGLETFLSGFLMAGPMGAMQSAFYGTVDMVKQKKLKADAAAFAENPDNVDKENPFQRELDIQADFENKTLEAMNETTKNAPAYFSALERDIKIQNDLARTADEAAAGGDVKAAKDARDASLVSHTLTLLQAGKFNVFEEQLKSLGELSGTELQEAFGEDPNGTGKTVAERLKNVMGRVKEIKSSFEEYQSMVNPHTMEKNPLGFLAFEQAREVMVHDDIRYKRTGQRMADLYTEFSSNLPFSKANGADFANLFSIGDPNSQSIIGRAGMYSEIALLNQEIAVAEAGDATSKLRAESLKKKRDSLSSLSALVQLHKSQYTVNQSINHTDESFAENEKALADLDIQLKDSFVNHIKLLAEQNGQNVLTKDLDRAYQQFSDYWKLNADQGQVANALNALHDPYMFNQAQDRLKAAMTAAMSQREAKLKEALKEFSARRHKNKFFNDLFDNFNAFIDPEEADAYINENEVPTTFFDAETMEEIQPGSEKYKGIMALIDEYDEAYFEKEGKRMMRTGTGGLMSFRGKEENDKRTIKQLGEEYGFDHTDVLSYVNIEKVLKAVITSKFASKDMKKLAQALLSIVDKNTQITFKTNHFTNSTYDDVNGVIVDPKFSAEGFTTGLVPMEFSILNGIMQQVMDKSLEDTDFNDRMTVLREKLIENLTDEQKKEFQLAMKDNSGFVAEVMTNPYIQGILDSIPLEGEATAQTAEAKTLWQSFLDEVKALLEKLFGSKRSASLYDEAVTVITNKLSQPGVVAADPIAEETFDEPTEDADLEKLLKEGFDAALAPLNAEERAGMNYQAWKDASREARDITNKYKADKIKKGTAPKPEGPTPLTESERKKQMTALGYTIAEMNSLTADQVNQIIAEKKKKRIYVDTLRGEMNFDEFPPMLDYIDDVIDEADLKLQSANLGLSADKKVYIQFDALGRPIAGTEHERVSNVVKTKDGEIGKESSDRGNIIDSLLRDFLNRTITDIEKFKTKYEEYRAENPSAGAFSEKMLEDLFDKFRSVELFIKQKGLKIRANIPALYGTIGETRTAGSIDLLAFDPAGRVFIIDLKTSTQDRRMQYKLEEMLEAAFGAEWPGVREVIRASKGDLYKAENRVSAEQKAKLKAIYTDPQFSSNIKKYKDTEYFPIYFYKSEDARQQNAYMELLRQTTGIKAYGTFIFPLILSKTNNIYTSVEFQKEDGNHTMNVKRYDIHKEMGLENQVTAYPEDPLSKEKLDEFRETPEEKPVPTTTTESTTTTENQIADIARRKQENDVKYAEMQARQKKELEDLNKKEGKNYRDAFDILNVNEYSEDQSQRSQEAIDLANRHEKEFEKLLNEKRGIEDDAAKISYGGRDLSQKQALVAKLKDLLSNIYQTNRNALEEGFMIAPNALAEAEKVGGVNYSAHGMAKTGLAGATEALIDLFTNGINPLKGRGALDTAPLAGGISVGTTAGGNAYMEGPFTLVANKSVQGAITSVDQIAGVVVNEGIATEEVLNTLRELFPDIVFESTSNTSKLVEQLNAKTTTTTTEEQPTEKTTEQTIADLRAREQVELRKAIPNIDDYPDTYGEKQGNMPGVLYGIYKVIYDKYDKLITDAAGTKAKTTQKPAGKVELTNALRDILKENPELAAIGTAEQYAEYLSSIFPESVLKNIFYRGTPDPNMIEAEDLDPEKGTGARNLGKGLYWTPNKKKASNYIGKGGRILAAILNTKNFHVTDINSITQRGYITPGDLTVSEVTNGADTLISYKGLDKENHVAFKTDGTGITHISEYVGPVDENGLPAYQEENAATPEFDQLAVNSNEQVHILGSKKDIQGFKDFASKGKPGTQTQMDFDELTLNVGDRVKVNTPKDGEGIIKEDRGDKVLLEDGRQVMKKSLTKLEPVDNEPVIVESTIPESLRGKVIFVTPTKASTTMLTGMPGVTYGSTIYLDRVLEGFDDTLIGNLRNGIEKLSEETDDAKKVKEAGTELLDILDRYKSPDKDVTTDDVKTVNGALERLTNQTATSYIPASIITKLKRIQSTAWDKTMSDARSLANEGQTVVFDLNGAAASGKIDLALISSTSDLGTLGYNYGKAIANIKGKSYDITGKNILDILNGTVDLDFTIPEIIREKLLANINEASKKELATLEILVNALPKAILDQVLASQNLTMEQVDKAIAVRKNKLSTVFDMDDLVVDKANPTVVQYTVNEITGKQEFGGQGRKQGVVISNDGLRVRLAEFVPGLSFEDLEESENVVTFTAKEIPYFILPLKPQTPTTVDPDVNAQSDAMMNDPVSDPGTSMGNLQNDLDSAKNVSAADALASFKKNQKCNKKGK